MLNRKNSGALWTSGYIRNYSLGIAMGALFVCAIYVYSMGAASLGSWGEVPGWIIFMSIDITTGNLWGFWTGEWKGAPSWARKLLIGGMVIILVAVITVAASQFMNNSS
jgi:L-rhamnose-H+ transport protein